MDQTTYPKPIPEKLAHKPRTQRLLHLKVSTESFKRLSAHAALRGWTIEQLCNDLLNRIAYDNLTNAVLDDDAQPTIAPAHSLGPHQGAGDALEGK